MFTAIPKMHRSRHWIYLNFTEKHFPNLKDCLLLKNCNNFEIWFKKWELRHKLRIGCKTDKNIFLYEIQGILVGLLR